MSGGRPITRDAWLWDDELGIERDILLFGSRVCRACGRRLPSNSDYFSPTGRGVGGLKPVCKYCYRERYRASNAAAAQRRRAAQRVAAP